MALILSCLARDGRHARHLLDHLRDAGWPAEHILVLHADDPLPSDTGGELPREAAVVGGGSGAVAAGAFGWLVGYGVLAVPAAVLGAAIGSAAGAVVGSSGDDDEAALRRSVLGRYRPHIQGERCAILVRADDARGYDRVMAIFRDAGAEIVEVAGKGRLESRANA